MTVIETVETKEINVSKNINFWNTLGTQKTSFQNISANGFDVYVNSGVLNCVFGYTTLGVGSVGTSSNVILQVISTTKGSIPAPAMSTAQKNTLAALTPPEGTMVYDTGLHKLCVWTGAAFETVTSA